MRGCSSELYLTTGAQHSMPRQLIRRIGSQQPGDGTMEAWITGSTGDSAIRAHLARRDRENNPAKYDIAWFV